MTETPSRLANSLDYYWSEQAADVRVVDEPEFHERLIQVYQLGDMALVGMAIAKNGYKVFSVIPDWPTRRQQLTDRLRASSDNPELHVDPPAPKGPLSRSEAEQRVARLLTNQRKIEKYNQGSKLRRFGEVIKFFAGRDSIYPSSIEGDQEVPDILVLHTGEDNHVSEMIVNRTAEERFIAKASRAS